jgi:PAS domain S-box-containing protein
MEIDEHRKKRTSPRAVVKRPSVGIYDLVLANLSETVILADKRGFIVYVSPNAAAVLGYSPEDLQAFGSIGAFLGEELFDPTGSDPVAEVREFERTLTGGDGRERIFLITVKKDSVGGGTIVSVFRDITERRQAEMALAESERFLSSVFASVPDGISVVDKDLTILRVNPAMESRYQNAAPLVGKKCYTAYHNRPESCAVCPALRTIETGETQREVILRPYMPGEGVGWVDLHSFPLVDSETGGVRGVVVFARNVTDRKKAEDLLIQNARLEAVAHLSQGISHNFNNLLQVILGNADLALADLAAGDFLRLQHYLARIVDNSCLGARVVKGLQEFIATRTEATSDHTEILDLTDTVARGIELAGPWCEPEPEEHGKNVRLFQMLRTGCFVKGDTRQLLDVVVHLLRNAAEAVAGGGEIRVSTKVEGNEVVLCVEDSGIGIAKENQYRVFEPFYTTRGPGRIGMGLASSLGIVVGHYGKIGVESEEGAGTTFTVRLPLAARLVAELPREPSESL